MRRALGMLTLGILLVAATPTAFGGWAVVTVKDIPEYLEVGAPTTLEFHLRQHGRTLLDDRSPTVTLRPAQAGLLSGLFKRHRVRAEKTSELGLYTATITPPDTGEVVISIDTDLFGWKVDLLPLRVVAGGRAPAALSPVDRGRHLFAAKGCATCHAKQDDRAFADWHVVSVGPALGGRAFPADWLAKKLADPTSVRSTVASDAPMPNLALSAAEIDALVQYVNHRQGLAARGGAQ